MDRKIRAGGLAVLIVALGAASSRAAIVSENVIWTNPRGNVTIDGNSIWRTGGATVPIAPGANSVQIIGANQDGFAQFIARSTNTNRVFGFQDAAEHLLEVIDPHNMDTIDFGIQLNANGLLRLRENGRVIPRIRPSYAAEDVLRIERTAGWISYFQDDVLLYRSTVRSHSALILDASLRSGGAEISGAMITSVNPEPATLVVWSLLGGVGLVVGLRRRRQAAADGTF